MFFAFFFLFFSFFVFAGPSASAAALAPKVSGSYKLSFITFSFKDLYTNHQVLALKAMLSLFYPAVDARSLFLLPENDHMPHIFTKDSHSTPHPPINFPYESPFGRFSSAPCLSPCPVNYCGAIFRNLASSTKRIKRTKLHRLRSKNLNRRRLDSCGQLSAKDAVAHESQHQDPILNAQMEVASWRARV